MWKFIAKYALFHLLIAYLLLRVFNCQFEPKVSENYKIDFFSYDIYWFLALIHVFITGRFSVQQLSIKQFLGGLWQSKSLIPRILCMPCLATKLLDLFYEGLVFALCCSVVLEDIWQKGIEYWRWTLQNQNQNQERGEKRKRKLIQIVLKRGDTEKTLDKIWGTETKRQRHKLLEIWCLS